MLETLITSKTRMKLLLKFFLNSRSTSYLRNLATEFGESTNAIRMELNRFNDAGLLEARLSGNKKIFRANTSHPLYPDIRNILMKHIGLDSIVGSIVEKLGDVDRVYVGGDFAKGRDSKIIDLILVGDVNQSYLLGLTEKVEQKIGRKIRYAVFSREEFRDFHDGRHEELLLLWETRKEKEANE